MSAQINYKAADINTILTKSATSVTISASTIDVELDYKNVNDASVYVATIPSATRISAGVVSAADYSEFKGYGSKITQIESKVATIPDVANKAYVAIGSVEGDNSLMIQFFKDTKRLFDVELPAVSSTTNGVVSKSDYPAIKNAPLMLSAAKVEGVEKVQSRGGNTRGVYVFDIYDNTFCLFVEGAYCKAWQPTQDPNGFGSSAYMNNRTLINVEGSLYARYNDKWIAVGTDSFVKVMPQSEFDALTSSQMDEKTIYMTY